MNEMEKLENISKEHKLILKKQFVLLMDKMKKYNSLSEDEKGKMAEEALHVYEKRGT